MRWRQYLEYLEQVEEVELDRRQYFILAIHAYVRAIF